MTASTSVLVLRDLVNSYEPQTGEERWVGPDELRDWLVAHALLVPGERLAASDLGQVRVLREGLRQVLRQHAGHDGDGEAIRRMDALFTSHPPRIQLGAGGVSVHAGASSALDQVVAGVTAAVQACQADGSWTRLKSCGRETCQWAYFDESRNRSRRWCSMEGCGNVLKMRRRSERSRA